MKLLTADQILEQSCLIIIGTHGIETIEYGLLSLQGYISVEDIDVVGRLLQEDVDAREFAARVLSRIIREPNIEVEEIHTWDDQLLASIVLSWADHEEVGWRLRQTVAPLEYFRQGFKIVHQSVDRLLKRSLESAIEMMWYYLPDWNKVLPIIQASHFPLSIIETVRQIQESFAGIGQRLSQQAQQIASSATVLSSMESFFRSSALCVFDSLPDINHLHQLHEWAERGAKAVQALDETGFGFLAHYWYDDLDIFLGLDQVDLRVRNAVMTVVDPQNWTSCLVQL